MSNYGVGLRNGVAFALGTIPSLTSGGTLRPSLLLDFLSGSLDSRITFSRGTQAMQYGSDGTLQYAPNNLLTYSNQADNAAWTKSNSFVQQNLIIQSQAFDSAAWSKTTATVVADTTTAPDGTLTADTVTATTVGLNTGFLAQTVTFAASTSYAYSIYVKHGTESSVQLQAICTVGATNSGCVVSFNVTSGSVSTVFNYGSISGATASITLAANGFYRCTLVIPVPAGVITSGAVWFFPYSGSDAAGTYAYAWGAQLVQGSVPGDYRATTSAALPVLYADYNGALRARKLSESTATAPHYAYQGVYPAATYTISCYAKQGERTRFGIGNVNSGNYAYFNLATGVVTNAGTGDVSGGTMISLGNGWYRCYAVCVATTSWSMGIITTDAAGNITYAGDGSSGIYIADAQLTPGYLPLAVTETTSAAVYGPRFDYDPSSLVTQNLLTYSQAFENVVWGAGDATHVISANSVTAPDGTLTADVWTFPASSVAFGYNTQIISSPNANQALTFSVWARVQSGTKNIKLRFSNVTVATVSSADIALTTTWQRISYTIAAGTLAATTQIGVGFYFASSNSLVAGDLVELWGAQLNYGSTALPYTATTTAPYTLTTARGLLIEEQRTNLLLQSNDFFTSWTPVNITRTPNATLSPEGVVNGVKIEATAAAATSILQTVTVAATSATFSVYVKQGTGATTANNFGLRNVTTLTNLVFGTLNYSTGVFTYTVGSSGVVVTNVGNGWWRIAITATTGITAGDLCTGYVGFIGNAQAAGDFLYAYGAQLEAGAFATSYIPTVASTATRNADSASITTLTPWFNAAAGTFYASWDYIGAGSATNPNIRPALNISDGTSNNRIQIYNISGNDGAFIATGGVTQAALDMGSASAPNVIIKGAVSFATNDAIFARNGVLSAADTSVTLPTVTTLYIGAENNTNRLNGHLQSMRYYPTRLPNASLQSITA